MRHAEGGAIRRCKRCAMHEPLCLCETITPIALGTRVVVITNARELRKASNTARLARLCLTNAEVRVRGVRDQPLDLSDLAQPADGSTPLLLYPVDGARTLGPDDAPATLIVPDGNWRQARKVAMREHALADVERVVLPPGPPSRYRLRTHPDPSRISTFEAIARALALVEEPGVQDELLRWFDMMVERVLWTRGDLHDDQITTEFPEDPRAEYDRHAKAHEQATRKIVGANDSGP